ncbi:MAG: PAS domain S-box protein [Clostridia bacterium]|nr:PAS domain S-box protein [Clostridia bacterium]
MKPWVAVLAAFAAIVAIISLPVHSAIEIASDHNERNLSEMKSLCEMVGDMCVDVESVQRQQLISGLTLSDGIECGLFLMDGEPLYCSQEGMTLPANIFALQSFRDGNAHVYQGKDKSSRSLTYVVYFYANDEALAFTAQPLTWHYVLTHDGGMIAIFLVLLTGIGLFIAAWFSMYNRDLEMQQIMRTLDKISDGDFDARIQPISGKSRDINEYNAIIMRLQNRIFRQRSRNNALSVVMNQMQNGIVAVDQNLNVIFVTPVAKKLLGIVGNTEGKPISEASKDVRLDNVFQEAMQQTGVYTNEVAARTTVGRGHRPLRLYVSPMRNDGKVVGALAMIEDISDLKRLEQMRTDFAANVSHELKTPLTSIRGFVETLEAGAIDQPEMAHKFLRIIMMETERLTRLINDILSISKLESGNNEVAIERIRLDKIAYDVCDMLTIHAGEKQITLHASKNAEPIYIMGNPDRVEQMLINLVENGIKYNKPGGSVTVQVFSNGKDANVSISDTGIGIAEEHLPRMFERFYRVDKGRSRAMGGTGLGLAIVKHIVRTMNGEIEVHSKLGEGTEFLITIPVAPKDRPDADTIFDDQTEA